MLFIQLPHTEFTSDCEQYMIVDNGSLQRVRYLGNPKLLFISGSMASLCDFSAVWLARCLYNTHLSSLAFPVRLRLRVTSNPTLWFTSKNIQALLSLQRYDEMTRLPAKTGRSLMYLNLFLGSRLYQRRLSRSILNQKQKIY